MKFLIYLYIIVHYLCHLIISTANYNLTANRSNPVAPSDGKVGKM